VRVVDVQRPLALPVEGSTALTGALRREVRVELAGGIARLLLGKKILRVLIQRQDQQLLRRVLESPPNVLAGVAEKQRPEVVGTPVGVLLRHRRGARGEEVIWILAMNLC
jgi:hypothetical protein